MSVIAEELNAEEQALFEQMRGAEKAAAKPEAAPAKEAAKADEKQPEKAAEKPAEKAAEKKDEGAKRDSVVPAQALKEAREANKELRKELDGMKALVAAGDTKLQKFMEAVSKKAETAAPKFEDDPAGNLKAKAEALEKENAELKKGVEEINKRLASQDQAGQGAAKLQEFAGLVGSHEKEFAKEHPDYFLAADYVAATWRDEFVEMGFDEKVIPQMVFQKSLALTHKAVEAGRDPAAAIYNIAKRNGFSAKAAAETKGDEKPETKEEKSAGETKLETLKKGQEAAKANGGAKGPDDLTLASLAQMDDDQIDKLVSDPDWWSKNVRRTPLH